MTGDNGTPVTPDWTPDPHPWDETAYLLSSPANAARLRAAINYLDGLSVEDEPHIIRGTE